MSGSRTRLKEDAEAGCSKGKARCDKSNSEKIVSARNRFNQGAVLSGVTDDVAK